MNPKEVNVMPGFNGSGPTGMGPMTGWGRGRCAAGLGGRPFYGAGRGRRWLGQRAFSGPGGFGYGQGAFQNPADPGSETSLLKGQESLVSEELARIQARIRELESQK
ncbi:MAG: DUF5320 domain-containing protein [Candidatus Omnitrophota bacterium]